MCRRHHPYGRSWRATKKPLDKSEIGEWNIWFKLHIQKINIMAFGSITSWQIDGKLMETVKDFISRGSKITTDDDCSHEIKRCLLFWRKTMTKFYIFFKSRDITLLKKFSIIKAMIFSSCHVWMWQLHHKEWWAMKNWWFWTVALDKTLESPLDFKEIHPVILKEINPEY